MASSTSTRPGQNVFRPIYKRNQERPPDIVSDFIVAPTTTVDANFFTFTGMRALVGGAPPTTFKVLKATLAEFPDLNQLWRFLLLEAQMPELFQFPALCSPGELMAIYWP